MPDDTGQADPSRRVLDGTSPHDGSLCGLARQ
jgi:hypothetical protein